MVDQLGYETGKKVPEVLQFISGRTRVMRQRSDAIVDALEKKMSGNALRNPKIGEGVQALLAFMSRQSGLDHPPIDYKAIAALADMNWPDAQVLKELDQDIAEDINFLHDFANQIQNPSTRHLVQEGLDVLIGELASTASASGPRSIPELVTRLSSGEFRPADGSWRLGNLLQPDNPFGFHELSAASMGHRLLVVLAIAQDPGCVKSSGELDAGRTQSVIRGWGKPPQALTLDPRILQGIRLDAAQGKLQFGNHAELAIDMGDIQTLRNSLRNNEQLAGLGTQALALDLSGIPKIPVHTNFKEAVLGDMHGNSVLFLHQLVQLGFAKIRPGKEKAWEALVEKIRGNDLTGFSAQLAEVLELRAKDKKLVLLGDMLADRAHNDWFMLCLVDFLHQQGQQFDIIFSNHDATFVEYYLANKDVTAQYQIRPRGTALQLAGNDSKSLTRLNETLNKEKELREQFRKMTENYLAHLRLASFNKDQQVLYAHAVVNEAMLSDMLQISGTAGDDGGSLPIGQKIDRIQQYFQTEALTDIGQYRRLFGKPSWPGVNGQSAANNPFYFVIWNRGPFADDESFSVNTSHPYANALSPAGVQRCVHGHTEDIAMKRANRQQREQAYRDLQSSLAQPADSEAAIARARAWAQSGLRLLQAERHPASSAAVLILALQESVAPPSSAATPELRQRIQAFLDDCRAKASAKPDTRSVTQLRTDLETLLPDLAGQPPAALPDADRLDELAFSMLEQFNISNARARERPATEQIEELAGRALRGLTGSSFYPVEAAESDHMAAYRSLDAPFGKSEQDNTGDRLALLL